MRRLILIKPGCTAKSTAGAEATATAVADGRAASSPPEAVLVTPKRHYSKSREAKPGAKYETCKECGSTWPKWCRVEYNWDHCGNCGHSLEVNP